MNWTAISGSWRTVNAEVEADVRRDVKAIMSAGDGIVAGGALGVDYIATDSALACDPSAARIKVIIPTSLAAFSRHYFRRADEGVITHAQAASVVSQLEQVRAANTAALIELAFEVCTPETYYARNTAVIDAASSLRAYQVNDSAGTQDTIDKAVRKGIDVRLKKYTIPQP